MPFTLTAHAAFEMERRQIPLAWVESVFYSPEQVLAGQGGRVIHQSRVLANGKVYLVRLVLESWRNPPVLVTVYRSSKIDKYWSPT